MDCAGTHAARLRARIKGKMCELFRGIIPACQPHEIGFSMSGAIPPRNNRIFSFQHNPVMLIYQHCTEGMVAMLARPPCHRNG